MVHPWNISADDLETWASRIDAAAMLPTLVRRLLAATVPLQSLDLWTGDREHRGSSDGIVLAREQRPFCAKGTSVWAFSVDQGIQAKLDENFNQHARTPPAPIAVQECTYVAVTPWRFPEKHLWAAEKKALGVWGDVRVYDAGDLAAWLGSAPAVSCWFADQIGRRSGGMMDVETYLAEWSHRTTPLLPFEIVLVEREQEASAVRTWLSHTHPLPLHIRGDTKEEAVLFVAAVLSTTPSAERELWLARAVVVKKRELWRSIAATAASESLILLPEFAGFDPSQFPSRGHRVVPLDGSAAGKGESAIVLERLPWGRLAKVLSGAGFDEATASRLARASGGKIAVLQQLCGYTGLPPWAETLPKSSLFAMLLVGAWVPGNDADRHVVEALGGDATEMEQLCNALVRNPGVGIVQEQRAWKWSSPADAWRALASELTAEHLARFEKVATQVLGELDPVYDLPTSEHIYAPLQGKVLAHSAELRAGLIESIVRLALGDPGDSTNLSKLGGSDIARRIVSSLLAPGWAHWASLSRFLPSLAEAAPEVFLDALEKSLDNNEGGVCHLFANEGSFSSPHVGLLWALETLGWDRKLMPRTAVLLARLAARDPGGKLANRPAASLANLLHVLKPQSTVSVRQRVDTLQTILEIEPDVGWRLALGMLESLRTAFLAPARRPRYLPWVLPPEDAKPTASEMYEHLSGAVDLLIEHAGEDGERWTALLDLVFHLPDDLAIRLLDSLLTAREHISDPEGRIWTTLREMLHLQHFPAQEAIPPGLGLRIETLYQAFTPDGFIPRVSWLFQFAPNLPEHIEGGWEEEEAHLQARRLAAVEDLWEHSDRWDALAELTTTVEAPEHLGSTLGMSAIASDVEQGLLDSSADGPYAPLLPSFFATRLAAKGFSWLADVLHRLLAQNRVSDATCITVILTPRAQLWDFLDSAGEPIRSEYWRNMGGLYGEHPRAEWERAIANLLEVGRIAAAVKTASSAKAMVSTAVMMDVLDRMREAMLAEEKPGSVRSEVASHHLERLFEALDQESTIDMNRVARIELFFLPWIEQSARSWKRMFAAISESAELFATLVNAVYRAEGEPTAEGATVEERQKRAQKAYALLSAWKGFPGDGLPDDAREARLLAWARRALEQTAAAGRGAVGIIEVAKVLARAPAAPDSMWPCHAARVLLQSGACEPLADALYVAKRNQRGLVTQTMELGGAQERALAETFRTSAEKLRLDWPRTAAVLANLAHAYEREAADATVRLRQIER